MPWRRTAGQAGHDKKEITFGFWTGKLGLAFCDICCGTEMHMEGQRKWGKKTGMTVHMGPISYLLSGQQGRQ